MALAMPIGMVVFGPLADVVPIEWLLVAAGVLTFVVLGARGLAARRPARRRRRARCIACGRPGRRARRPRRPPCTRRTCLVGSSACCSRPDHPPERVRPARAAHARSRRRARRRPTVGLEHAWYTSVPSPDGVAAEIEQRLAWHDEGSMNPWAVRRLDTGHVVGMTTFCNIDQANRHVEIGHTWIGRRGAAHRCQHGLQAPAPRPRVRAVRRDRRGVPHALAQPPVPRGDRATRGEAGRRAAQPPDRARTARSATPWSSRSSRTSGRRCGSAWRRASRRG